MNKPNYAKLIRRYIWLVDVINAAGHISKENIDCRWARNTSLNDDHEDYIPERTFHRHREAAAELFDIIISYDRQTNTYFIENTDRMKDNSMRQWLLSAMPTSNLISDAQHLEQQICFEPVPSGQKYLLTLVEAIRDHQCVEMTYQRFSVVDDGRKLLSNQPHTFILEPYCLKCFRQRWYVVGKIADSQSENNATDIKVYALDRIQSLTSTNIPYSIPKDFDAEAYFLYCYGVSGMYDKPELVKVKVTEQQANYIRTLPLHHSQQEVEHTDNYSVFTFFLVPTFEFQQALWQHMEHIEILAPDWLREDTQYKIKTLYEKYWK